MRGTHALAAFVLVLLGSGCDRGSPPRSPAPPLDPRYGDMVWIPGGRFRMGGDHRADERPVHEVLLHGFFLDRTEVTNAEFARFVAATGYVTVAERTPTAAELPDVPKELRVAGSLVFAAVPAAAAAGDFHAWWRYVPGACWRHPEGPDSDLSGRERHPVVHVAYDDALAYARFAGKRLPTEAEWEYAARGGLAAAEYPWGDEFDPAGPFRCNVWQGPFPERNDALDGYGGTAPVGSFAENGYGLFDMAGNVWEWCADWYRPDAYAHSAAQNPRGPDSGFDPAEPDLPKRVVRGGSYLCNPVSCAGYRCAARMKTSPDTGLCHTGFRCALDP